MSRYHDSNDSRGRQGLKPTRAVFFVRISFEESSVKCVRVVNEIPETIQSGPGHGRRTSQVLEETIKAVGRKTNDDVLFLGYFLC